MEINKGSVSLTSSRIVGPVKAGNCWLLKGREGKISFSFDKCIAIDSVSLDSASKLIMGEEYSNNTIRDFTVDGFSTRS